jgi:muramoyltetrapeptide carboxypeptidase LdcA involved in peptidoglycan recycling
VTAPSNGYGHPEFIRRHELIVNQHQKRGIEIIEGECLRNQNKGASDTKEKRAKDFINLWNEPRINLIQPPWGGEILIDILELLDFDFLKQKPKWVQGFSDISNLLFAITNITGIATAHGTNFIDSIEGQDNLTMNSRDYLSLPSGGVMTQHSSSRWQKKFINFTEQFDAKFSLTEPTRYQDLWGDDSVVMEGRIIGGCFDAIISLLGSRYGDIEHFFSKLAKNEGVILYFENCLLSPDDVYRFLCSFKYAGWFNNVNGVIFGRNNGPENHNVSYKDFLKDFFSAFDFPVVIEADIGHRPPQMTIINGSYATLEVTKGRATLKQKLD